MSKGDEWRESATKDVLFPDDLAGYGVITVVSAPLQASDVETDTVQFGTVAELHGDHHDADYVVAPQQLRAAIADAWRPDDDMAVLEILDAEKGPADDDPWRIDAKAVTKDQTHEGIPVEED